MCGKRWASSQLLNILEPGTKWFAMVDIIVLKAPAGTPKI